MSAVTASRPRSAAPRRAHGRGASAPAVPRRVSGPAGGRVRAQPRPQQGATAGARALSLVRSLPDHSLIDRLVRGRAWIPVLGVLLVGIVAMQVEILKVGTSLGRSLERTSSLQSQNESLQAGVAGLAEYQRIERLATGMGMVMPSPGLLTFVASHPRAQLGAGLGNIHAPDPTGFATQLATDMAAAELAAPTTNTSSQSGQTAGAQSTGTAGAATTAATGATTTGTSPASTGATSTGATSAGSTSAGSTGSRTSATGAETTGAASTTGAAGTAPTAGTPTTGTAATGTSPGAGTGASTGAAGLPSTSQSSGSGGG